jgi:hypothetical protein
MGEGGKVTWVTVGGVGMARVIVGQGMGRADDVAAAVPHTVMLRAEGDASWRHIEQVMGLSGASCFWRCKDVECRTEKLDQGTLPHLIDHPLHRSANRRTTHCAPGYPTGAAAAASTGMTRTTAMQSTVMRKIRTMMMMMMMMMLSCRHFTPAEELHTFTCGNRQRP